METTLLNAALERGGIAGVALGLVAVIVWLLINWVPDKCYEDVKAQNERLSAALTELGTSVAVLIDRGER